VEELVRERWLSRDYLDQPRRGEETTDDHPAADAMLALGRTYFVSTDPTLSAAEKLRALPELNREGESTGLV
jgi:hypothetical protein